MVGRLMVLGVGFSLALVPEQLADGTRREVVEPVAAHELAAYLVPPISALPPTDTIIAIPAPTTTPPAPSTTMAPPSTTEMPTRVEASALVLAEQAPDPRQAYLDKLRRTPGLQQLADQGVISQEEATAQLNHIEWLRQNLVISPEIYHTNFAVDNSSFVNVFQPHPHFNDPIEPGYMVIHWGARDYPDIPYMAQSMLNARDANGNPVRLNTHYVIDRGVLYRTTPPSHYFRGAHAIGANNDSIGIEHNRVLNMMDVQPGDTADTVMTIVYLARDRGWPIDDWYVRTHSDIDLLENNAGYNPETGVLSGNLRKLDYPRDYLVNVLIPAAQALDAALGPRP